MNLEVRGISKSFGETRALSNVSLTFASGEVHAICGENGAGKSTLNRILCGLIRPDSGSVLFDGQPVELASVADAERRGIAMVHQESASFLALNGAENHQVMNEPVWAGGWWLDRSELARRAEESVRMLGEDFDLSEPLESQSLARRQMISIARAISSNCRVLILDEPTASLSKPESEALFRAVRKLRKEGLAILVVSHRLDEVFELADQISVLRDGELVHTSLKQETNPQEVVKRMVGREISASRTASNPSDRVALRVKQLSREPNFRNVNFELRSGEILGLGGLIGSGRSEIARVIAGIDDADSGEIEASGTIALVPEDRQHEGLHLPFSTSENIAMSTFSPALTRPKAELATATQMIELLGIKAAPETPVESLSGGNQQKTLIAKWISENPEVLILDEPTRGVDIGAKAQIHSHIRKMADEGAAILLISSEMPELLSLSTRVLVIRNGEVVGEVDPADSTEADVLSLALPDSDSAASVASSTRRKFSQPVLVGGLLLLLIIAASIANPHFFAASTFSDLLVKIAPAMIVAVSMTLLIVAREIDISVGAQMGLCAAVLGVAASPDRMNLPYPVAILACLGTGIAAGLLNGILVAKAKIPSIIVTLGTMSVLRGVTELTMAGKWIENIPPELRTFGTGKLIGIPNIVWVAAIAATLGLWITRRTPFGLRVAALGSNPHAAHLRGIPETKIKLALFALVGLFCGIAALFSSTQLQVIESGFGSGFELIVIAAVVVGGSSIQGGKGTIFGTLLGALLLGAISTVLIFLNLGDSATYWERAIQGTLILVAVAGGHLFRARRNR